MRTCFDELAHGFIGSFDGLWNLVDILRLDDSLEIIFEDLGKVVCRLLIKTLDSMRLLAAYFEALSHGSTSGSPPNLADYRSGPNWA